MCKRISVYLHYPYCLQKCRYCAFYSKAEPAQDLTESYLGELAQYSEILSNRTVQTVYFGGGTPSLMSPNTIEAVLASLPLSSNPEITIEVNPATVDLNKLKSFKSAGINRLSIGIQSLSDDELAYLGRIHSAADALKTLTEGRQIFDNISADFIYGLPNQSAKDWQKALEKIKELNLQHLSLYQLTVEPKTPLARENPIIDEDETAKMFNLNRQVFRQYEVSNFAEKPYESQHNLNYWNGGEYLGLGKGAAGRIIINNQHFATFNGAISHPAKAGLEPITHKQRAAELLIGGLRTTAGINLKTFAENCGIPIEKIINPTIIANLKGYITLTKNTLKLTKRGLPFLDSLLPKIILYP